MILTVALAVVMGFACGVATASRLTPAPKPVAVPAPAATQTPSADADVFLKAVDDADGLSEKIESGAMPFDQGIKDLEQDSDAMAKLATTDADRAYQLAPDDFTHRRDMLRSAFAAWVSVIEIDKQIKLAGKGKLDAQIGLDIRQAQTNASDVQDYIENDTLPQ